MCECYRIGGKFIAEDPNCPVHGTFAVQQREAEELEDRRSYYHSYYDGMEEGARRFAWWKDGVQYVGTCGKTLEQAYAIIAAEREEAVRNVQ